MSLLFLGWIADLVFGSYPWGMVGGIVGMIGGLGGFVMPIIWGYLVDWTGIYPVSLFASLFVVSGISLAWLHYVVAKFMAPREARLAHAFEDHGEDREFFAAPTASSQRELIR